MGYCVISVKTERGSISVLLYVLGLNLVMKCSHFHIPSQMFFKTYVFVCCLWQPLLDTANLLWLLCTPLIARRAPGPWCLSTWTPRAVLASMSSRACLPTSPRFLSAKSDSSWPSLWWVKLATDCVTVAFVLYEMVLVTSGLNSITGCVTTCILNGAKNL